MARKPTGNDLTAHEGTYHGFLTLLKWIVLAIILTVVALYCFLEASNPVLGVILLLLIPVGGAFKAMTGFRP